MPTVRELVEWLNVKYGPEDYVACAIWNESDVDERAANLGFNFSKEERFKVLQRLHDCHDAQFGINWEILDTYIREVASG